MEGEEGKEEPQPLPFKPDESSRTLISWRVVSDLEPDATLEAGIKDLAQMGFTDRQLTTRMLLLHQFDIKKCVRNMMEIERDSDWRVV